MKFTKIIFISMSIIIASSAYAANSASIVTGSLIQGDVKSTMSGNSYAQETNALNDWNLDTGSWGGNKAAISLTNDNFNGSLWGGTPNSIVSFGNGGSVTLKLDNAIHDIAGEKELGLFTAQKILASSGGIFNGNMEAAILLSSDGTNWVTLDGSSVSQDYTSIGSKLNAPAHGYDYTTFAMAASYGSPGTSQANLDALNIADYTTPMPDDNIFNGTGTNADRLALKTNTTDLTYDAIFGTSGGGNWFDISGSGLQSVKYIQLNAVNNTPGYGIRLDAVFTTDASVPEPASMLLLGLGSILLRRKK